MRLKQIVDLKELNLINFILNLKFDNSKKLSKLTKVSTEMHQFDIKFHQKIIILIAKKIRYFNKSFDLKIEIMGKFLK